MAESFCDVGRGVTLCYETFGDPSDPPVLLVMGLGMQMLGWHEDFCADLAERGFHVVRFDNRDAGLSTHFKGRPPTLRQLISRQVPLRPVPAVRHGRGHGGAATRARPGASPHRRRLDGRHDRPDAGRRHPASVRTLTSIMSTTGNRFKGQPALRLYRALLRSAPNEREAFIEHMTGVFTMIGSPGFPRDLDFIRERAARSYDRDHDPAATGRQLAGILASGDRTAELRRISAPTLVIHGAADRSWLPRGAVPRRRRSPGPAHDDRGNGTRSASRRLATDPRRDRGAHGPRRSAPGRRVAAFSIPQGPLPRPLR